MRLEEVDELQFQSLGMSSTCLSFLRSTWSHVTNMCDVLVRVRLIRWLNGCFVGKQEAGVSAVCWRRWCSYRNGIVAASAGVDGGDCDDDDDDDNDDYDDDDFYVDVEFMSAQRMIQIRKIVLHEPRSLLNVERGWGTQPASHASVRFYSPSAPLSLPGLFMAISISPANGPSMSPSAIADTFPSLQSMHLAVPSSPSAPPLHCNSTLPGFHPPLPPPSSSQALVELLNNCDLGLTHVHANPRDVAFVLMDHWQDVEVAITCANREKNETFSCSIFAAESFTFMCTSASGRTGSRKCTSHSTTDLRNSTAELPALLQSCLSSMLAGEYSLFVVPAGKDKEWDQAMLAAGCKSSCHYVQMAMLHFQRRGVCADRSTASVTIVRHSNMWSVGRAASALQSTALVSASIGDGTVVTLSYAVRSSSSCQWLEVAHSLDVIVGSADLPMGLDAAVRSMQVRLVYWHQNIDHHAASCRWPSYAMYTALLRMRMRQRCLLVEFQKE